MSLVEVYVKLPTGKSSRYEVYPSQQLSVLCDKVAAEESVRSNQVTLKYQGKTLDNNKTIAEYGVRVETILKAQILIPENLDIVVKFEDGNIDEVVLSNLEPVSELYKAVAAKKSLVLSRLQLKIEGRVLASSSATLMNAGLAKGTTVTANELKIDEYSLKSRHRNTHSSGDLTRCSRASNVLLNEPTPINEDIQQSILSSFDAKGRSVEVAFSFDTTGSMYSYLNQVRQKLRDCCTRLIQDIQNIRISFIAHGDYCDSENLYAVRLLDFTSNVQALVDFAQNVPATSGGDTPECYELVLRKALELDWSEDSAKALIVIGDSHPQPPSYTDQHIYWRNELEILAGMDVKVYGVQAGSCMTSAKFYREISDISRGCYLNLNHLDVITDMFLAVCYGETNNAMLEDFEKELVDRGQMTEVKKTMFRQLRGEQKDKDRSLLPSETEKEDIGRVSVSSQEEENGDSALFSRAERHVRPHGRSYFSHRRAKKSWRGQESLKEGWWDPTFDNGSLHYIYNANIDKWILASQASLSVSPPKSAPVLVPAPVSMPTLESPSTSSKGKNKSKKWCFW